MKPFPKTERKVVTVTIDESGDLVFLNSPEHDVFLELGETLTTRASHVEPYALLPRLLFTAIRYFVHDDSKLAAWTRGWECGWRVNTSPVGGPILTCGHVWDDLGRWDKVFHSMDDTAVWGDRKAAIRAEVKFLNTFFLGGK